MQSRCLSLCWGPWRVTGGDGPAAETFERTRRRPNAPTGCDVTTVRPAQAPPLGRRVISIHVVGEGWGRTSGANAALGKASELVDTVAGRSAAHGAARCAARRRVTCMLMLLQKSSEQRKGEACSGSSQSRARRSRRSRRPMKTPSRRCGDRSVRQGSVRHGSRAHDAWKTAQAE